MDELLAMNITEFRDRTIGYVHIYTERVYVHIPRVSDFDSALWDEWTWRHGSREPEISRF